MTPSDSPFARCYDLCGDHRAAIVFERLTYWWTRGLRPFKGVEWRVKPRAELARECRMTEHELRRAMDKLKDRHLIETEAHRFGTVGPVMHYRFLPRAIIYFGPTESPVSEGPVLVKNDQLLEHNGGNLSKNPYGVSKDTPPEFLDADGLSLSKVSGKNGQTDLGENVFPKKSTPKAPSAAKAAISAKLGMSASAILAAKKVDGVFPGAKAIGQ